jgi:NH3-dependent NAD+ synthetase
MGVTYDELDTYLLGGKIDDNKVKQIEHLHRFQ